MAKNERKYRVKAAADSPDFVAHGNLEAEKVKGYFETTNERFAAFLTASYGVEANIEETEDDTNGGQE